MAKTSSCLLIFGLAVFASANLVSARTEPGRELLEEPNHGWCWCYEKCGQPQPGCPTGLEPVNDGDFITGFVKACIELGAGAALGLKALINVDASIALAVLLALKANIAVFATVCLAVLRLDVNLLVRVCHLQLDLLLSILGSIDVLANVHLCASFIAALALVVDVRVLVLLFVGNQNICSPKIIGSILNQCGGYPICNQIVTICAQVSLPYFNALKPFCPNILGLFLNVTNLLGVVVGIGK
jgi:hypothetical protein